MTMRFLLASLLLAVLAACVPAAEPIAERDGDTVRITVRANESLYDTTLSVINAETNDERCVTLGETDLACVLGTIPAGGEAIVMVTSEGALSCIAFSLLEPNSLSTYRPWPCTIE